MIDNTFNKLLTEEMGIIRNVQTDTTAIADKIKHLKGDELLSNDNIKAKYQAVNRNFVSNSENVRVIASVLYLTYKFEQDAF